jgi:hypothetical protein
MKGLKPAHWAEEDGSRHDLGGVLGREAFE